jgi:hypothetical protein
VSDHAYEQVIHWLEGTYSNREQALEDPVWYIPVTLWYVKLPGLFEQGMGFFTEQVNQHTPQAFYRSRVLQLMRDPLRLENYKLKDQAAWAGASQQAERLGQLTPTDLDLLPDCTIYLTPNADQIEGRMNPGHRCKLNPTDRVAIEISFELYADRFLTLDRGIDIATGRQTWGSKLGSYDYRKQGPPPVLV